MSRKTVKEILTAKPTGPVNGSEWEIREWIRTCDSIEELNDFIHAAHPDWLAYNNAVARREALHFEANQQSGSVAICWARIAAFAAIVGVLVVVGQWIYQVYSANKPHEESNQSGQSLSPQKQISTMPVLTNSSLPSKTH
jgi:hypothetical protein